MGKISLSYPDTGLTISISVKNRDTGVEDFSGVMTEVGTTREYKYDFTEVIDTDYVYVATVAGYSDMSGVIYRDGGGLTTEERNKLMNFVSGGWGDGIDAQDKKYIRETHEKVSKLENTDISIIETKLNETISHIDIAKGEIIDTIEESENGICKDIKVVNKELQEDNVATRQLVRQKAKKQEEYIQKQLDSEAKTQKMIESEADSIEEELEQMYEIEVDYIIKEIEDLHNKEADSIEDEIKSISK